MAWAFEKALIIFVISLGLCLAATTGQGLSKIFTHDRGPSQELKKAGRFDDLDEVEYIKRAIDQFKETVPQYTGFYLFDFIFEIIKNIIVLFLTFLAPVESSHGVGSNTHASNDITNIITP